jgi:SAM-dependent methyltransferase
VLLGTRLREIGLSADEMRDTSPRHAAVRDDPVALAMRLFRDGAALTDEEYGQVCGACDLPEGFVVDGTASYRLAIVEDLYLFSDWPSEAADEVMPPGETTAILYRAARALCRAGDSVLDVGCGSGTLALLLARTAGQAIGTDVNPGAIALARLNAEINGIENVEFRLGSLYGPVEGERFDLVVSQPPYIPRPSGIPRHLFLHGGTRGDELARAILGGLAEHLAGEGRGLVFSDWALAEGEELRDRAAAPGLRTTLLASPGVTLESYARCYGEDLERHFAELDVRGVRQCLAICEAGSGVTERDVLPHEWREIALILPSDRREDDRKRRRS